MIICNKCRKPIPEMLPCKVIFNSMEITKGFGIQEHNISVDVCIDCQAKILNTLGKYLVRCDKENGHEFIDDKDYLFNKKYNAD